MNAPQFDEPLPARLAHRPRDHRGFITPHFVSWFDDAGREVEPPNGTPDFRIVNPAKRLRCIRDRHCWLCGQPLGRYLVFAIGPMCALTRTTMEPASHYECARYAVRVCPFMTRPRMRRNTVGMPETRSVPGLLIDRNPGVTALWVARGFTLFRASGEGGGTPGVLITVGEPERIEWWAEGRAATRAEVLESIESGLPILRANADREGPAARRALEETYVPRLTKVLPS